MVFTPIIRAEVIVKLTGWLKPTTDVTVMTVVFMLPCWTITLSGCVESLKSGSVGMAVTVIVILT